MLSLTVRIKCVKTTMYGNCIRCTLRLCTSATLPSNPIIFFNNSSLLEYCYKNKTFISTKFNCFIDKLSKTNIIYHHTSIK